MGPFRTQVHLDCGEPRTDGRYEQAVFDDVFELTRDASLFTNLQSLLAVHQIFVLRPSPNLGELKS